MIDFQSYSEASRLRTEAILAARFERVERAVREAPGHSPDRPKLEQGWTADCPLCPWNKPTRFFITREGVLVACPAGHDSVQINEDMEEMREAVEAEKPTEPDGNPFIASHSRFSAASLLADPPELKFVIWPFVPAETVSILSGPGGSNKTTLMVYAAVCRALKRQMFKGVLPEEGETVILTTEDRLDDYHRKLAALREYMGHEFDAELVSQRLHFMDMSGTPIRLITSDRGEQYVPTAHVELLAAALRAKAPKADWLIMETVSRLAGGVENNASHSILVEATQRVCRLAKFAATLVTHVSQEAARSGTADAYSARGGSALGDNGRASMVLTRMTATNRDEFAKGFTLSDEDMERTLIWALPKANGVPPQKPRLLWRQTTRFGPVLVDAELVPLEAGGSRAVVRPGPRPRRTFSEIKKAIIECIMLEELPISSNGVSARVGGTKSTVLEAIKELIRDGSLLDGERGLEVVRIQLEPISNRSQTSTGEPEPVAGSSSRGNNYYPPGELEPPRGIGSVPRGNPNQQLEPGAK